jgi:outer membrane lipoprotein-sorting protein
MSDGHVEQSLRDVGETLRQQPSVRDAVMRRVTEASLSAGGTAATRPSSSRRGFIGRLAAIAACAVIGTVLWGVWGGNGGGLGAQQAFAAAIANVEKARTFSARKIHRWVEDGREQMSVWEVKFREPDRERLEHVTGLHPEREVMITDYKARLRLQLYPDKKMAQMQDISTLYAVDHNTGRVKLSQLSTRERDDVLKISAQAVKDLGVQKLDGRDARVLRSADENEPVKTVWVEPRTGKPVQIELSWPSRKASFTYASIRIDEVLDETLFELDVPPGYEMLDGDAKPKKYIDEINGKMLSKARDLVMACYKYAEKKGDFPAEIADLKGVVMNEAALKAILADPDKPEGPPVLLYRKPRKGTDSGLEIVVYEAPEFRRPGMVVAGMWDGHAQILTAEEFERQMK